MFTSVRKQYCHFNYLSRSIRPSQLFIHKELSTGCQNEREVLLYTKGNLCMNQGTIIPPTLRPVDLNDLHSAYQSSENTGTVCESGSLVAFIKKLSCVFAQIII
ncbi:hypothetical protein EWB00_000752 [Schistosoma japonicum]|uniref:Uncharacterized protein n=1 Tax=Schistosoma japonicum TaxID=6182 RepID=A0A4Z2DHY9_SCHJA|nr:hypothetical protein EWB00_000752 [Schistosoma japonicum]